MNFTAPPARHLLLLCGVGLVMLIAACRTQQRSIRPLTETEVVRLERSNERPRRRSCQDREGYDPAIYSPPMRYVRVNFHFMNHSDSSANYSIKTGTHFARDLIAQANSDLSKNASMNLPLGNTTPTYPTQYRYVLSPAKNNPDGEGIYFHYDDELYYFIHEGRNRNSTSKKVLEKYCVQPDSVLNVFVMPHHPDSVASKTYRERQTGIALGTSIKISGIVEKKGYQPWLFRGLLNHEIGHVLGIHHTWRSNDGCDDTPRHPNCWHRTKDGSACDSLNSNNVMDYNLNQNAWTPCQLSKIHRNFANISSKQRKLLVRNWCDLDTTQNISIRDSVHWSVSRDLAGHLTVESGGVLKISCRASFPKDGQITVMPGAELILDEAFLHSDCGGSWAGIKLVEERGQTVGRVTFIGEPKIHHTTVFAPPTKQPGD
ncbi:MAG: M43 family zinc metalloprotease [Bacteroidota bacterium]